MFDDFEKRELVKKLLAILKEANVTIGQAENVLELAKEELKHVRLGN